MRPDIYSRGNFQYVSKQGGVVFAGLLRRRSMEVTGKLMKKRRNSKESTEFRGNHRKSKEVQGNQKTSKEFEGHQTKPIVIPKYTPGGRSWGGLLMRPQRERGGAWGFMGPSMKDDSLK